MDELPEEYKLGVNVCDIDMDRKMHWLIDLGVKIARE